MIYLSFLFAFLFVSFRELSEHAKEGNFKGYPDWWNTPRSFTNKHEWKPNWLFKSAMVWVTDAEHFFQMFSLLSVVASTYILAGWETALAFYLGNVVAGFLKRFTNIR